MAPAVLAGAFGVAVGTIVVVASSDSGKWAFAAIAALVACVVALTVRDLQRALVVVFLADMGLGVDYALQNRAGHLGGPSGFIVSVSTAAIVVGYMLWLAERKPKFRLPVSAALPLLLYLLVRVLSGFNARDLELSAFSVFADLQLIAMFIYVVNHVRTESDLRLVANAVMAFLLVESALMIAQYIAGGGLGISTPVSSDALPDAAGGEGVVGVRAAGSLGNPAVAAVFVNSMLAIVLSAVLSGRLVDRRIAVLAMSLGMVALIATSSRGGWTAMVVAVAVVLVRAARSSIDKRALTAFLVGALVVGVAFAGPLAQRYATIANDPTRAQLGQAALNLISAFPFGVGANNYLVVMSDRYAHPAWVGHHLLPPHNRYLLTLAELGPQGLLAFGLLLGVPIWKARHWLLAKGGNSPQLLLGVGIVGALAAQMVQMTSEDFSSGPPMALQWFLLALLVVVNTMVAGAEGGDPARVGTLEGDGLRSGPPRRGLPR